MVFPWIRELGFRDGDRWRDRQLEWQLQSENPRSQLSECRHPFLLLASSSHCYWSQLRWPWRLTAILVRLKIQTTGPQNPKKTIFRKLLIRNTVHSTKKKKKRKTPNFFSSDASLVSASDLVMKL